ncbi:hypothetical protein [Synechococcus sp. BA-132 BA5]|uniref:hypothetical protein n=1 Tax=Synechococcus sp. BA-132 BA5 TaxID=3110252 RepID=UPI002B20015C|nr:hypothetical protein [Synechococcus sp. BA-132 BA5]MEA5416286.1 hypothetical protein [Synechococcus sp. BA-132 BA5]
MSVNNGEPTHHEQWNAGYDAGYEDGAVTRAATVNALQEQLRYTEARYMALLKAVADGVAMQPRPMMMLTPEFMQAQADEAPRLDLGA